MSLRSTAFILMLAWLVDPACAENTKKHILILQSYNYSFPATSVAAEGLRTRLLEHSRYRFDLDTEYLDLARSTGAESREQLSLFLSSRYANRPLDVLIVVGGEALPFVIENRDRFAPGVPIVFLATSRESLSAWPQAPDVTGHIIDLDRNLDRTLALAERLQPNARELFLIAGSGVIDRRWQRVARRVVGGRARKYETTYLFELTYEDLIAKVSHAPKDAIVVLLSVFRDKTGQQFSPPNSTKTLVGASSAPIYTPYPQTASNKGAIGGFSESFADMGKTAADMALEILAEGTPKSIPVRTSPDARYWVDHESMTRWNLREDRLPPDTAVLFTPPPTRGVDRRLVAAAIVFIILQALLIAVLIGQRIRLGYAHAESDRHQSALRSSYGQLRHLAGRLLKAEDSERQRIARELHDDAGQQIASLSIGLSSLKRQVPVSQAPTLMALEDLQKQTLTLAEQMRDLSHDLHHGNLEHLGLIAALGERCEEIGRNSNITVVLDVAHQWTDSEMSDDLKLCLYRIAQESLRNIMKYAQATKIDISITGEDGYVVMKISDDGKGFDPNTLTRLNGIGILSMRERASMLHGTFEITSAPNQGTSTTVTIPSGG
jgi:signal transduction histidine kinase/ABC-type uncharacterized transport system substrate-binding protein